MDIRLCWPHLRFVGVLRANEGTVKLEVLDHACPFRFIFLSQNANHVRLILLDALAAFVPLDLGKDRIGLADTANKMMSMPEFIDLPAGENKDRGSVFDIVCEGKYVKAVLGFFSAKNSLCDPFQLLSGWVLHTKYCIIDETSNKVQTASNYIRQPLSFQ
jgi:hypothetical protein